MYGHSPSMDVGPASTEPTLPNISVTADMRDWKLSVELSGLGSTHISRISGSCVTSSSVFKPSANRIQLFVASGHVFDSSSAVRRASIWAVEVPMFAREGGKASDDVQSRKRRFGCLVASNCTRSSLVGDALFVCCVESPVTTIWGRVEGVAIISRIRPGG